MSINKTLNPATMAVISIFSPAMASAVTWSPIPGRCVGGAVVGGAEQMNEVVSFLRTGGPTMSAFNAWVFLKGLETLRLRMGAHSANALALARWLEAHPAVERTWTRAELMTRSGVNMARLLNVPEVVIGLTMVALGTSLPELAASLVSVVRGHPELAFGNVVGSNIFNLTFVAGTVSLINPLPVSREMLIIEIPIMIAFSMAMYALMFVAFRSHRHATIVLVNLPLALIGGVFAIAVSGGVVSVASMVGFITLFGIAVLPGSFQTWTVMVLQMS